MSAATSTAPAPALPSWEIVCADALDALPKIRDGAVHLCVTSIPYFGLRDYGSPHRAWGGDQSCDHAWGDALPPHHPGQVEQTKWRDAEAAGKGQTANAGRWCTRCDAWLGAYGLEPTVDLYVEHSVAIFREVRRVLRDDGSLWLNCGDGYAGGGNGGGGSFAKDSIRAARLGQDKNRQAPWKRGGRTPVGYKPKDLLGVPWQLALALRDDGWYLRCASPWVKRNPMPESVRDRPTLAHEYLFLLSKSPDYFYDVDGARVPSTGKPQRRGAPHKARQAHANLPPQTLSTVGPREDPAPDCDPAGRQRRTSDDWLVGLNEEIERARDHLARLEAVRTSGGAAFVGDDLAGVYSTTGSYKGAHLAVFPPALVEPLIRLSSSEGGACVRCGAPRRRVLGEPRRIGGRSSGNKLRDVADGRPGDRPGDHLGRGIPWHPTATPTIGWRPTCDCDAGSEPSIILDPFCGSGTAGVVATRLGRRFLGVDVSPEYCEMARRRIGGGP